MGIYAQTANGLFKQPGLGVQLVVSAPVSGWLTAGGGGQEPRACSVPSLTPCPGSALWLLPLLLPTEILLHSLLESGPLHLPVTLLLYFPDFGF